jgi:hypothetical protein
VLTKAETGSIRTLRRVLREGDRQAQRTLDKGLKRAAVPVLAEAKRLAPVGTRPKPPDVPHLRDSLKIGLKGSTPTLRSPLAYAWPIEAGWPAHHIKPSEFALRAIDSSGAAFDAALQHEVDGLLARLDHI